MTSESTKSNGTRIATNTITLFIRMFAIMVINLYAVRLVFQILGQQDYGVFNAVAGIVLSGSFITSTLAVAVQRYYSFAIGQHDTSRVKSIYSSSINIAIVLSIILIILFETIGLWFLHHKIVFPPNRCWAVQVIYQFSLFTFIIGILQIPFQAAIFAEENMRVYAIISFLECFGRLLVTISLFHIPFDHLSIYGIGLFIIALGVFFLYSIFAYRHYDYCRYSWVHRFTLYKELTGFAVWTMFGTIAGVFMIQGHTIIINMFFGPLINAAFSIANQIYNAFNALTNSIVLAFRPSMVKAYADGDYLFLNKAFSYGNKFIYYSMVGIALPMIFEINTILNTWLGKNVSPDIIIFSKLFIVYSIIIALHNPITILMQSSGTVKFYYSKVETFTILSVPVTYLLFKLHFPSWSVFASMITMSLLAHAVRIWCAKKKIKYFQLKEYFMQFLFPAIMITGFIIFTGWEFHTHIQHTYLRLAISFIVIPIITILLSTKFGMSKDERKVILNIFKLKMHK